MSGSFNLFQLLILSSWGECAKEPYLKLFSLQTTVHILSHGPAQQIPQEVCSPEHHASEHIAEV